jgi:hypothetical protein
MSITIQGYSVEELEGSGTMTFDRESGRQQGQRVYKVNGDHVLEFQKALLGFSRIIGNYSQRTSPHQFALAGGLYCVRTRAQGIPPIKQNARGNAYYDWWKVFASYEVPDTPREKEDESVDDDEEVVPYREESLDFSVDMLTLPSTSFKWNSDNQPIQAEIGKAMPMEDISYEFQHVTSLDEAKIRTYLGKINSVAWFDRTAKHVLFTGASARRTITNEGARDWRLTYNFKYRNQPWDKYWRPGVGWEQVTPAPYDTADFNSLINPLGTNGPS